MKSTQRILFQKPVPVPPAAPGLLLSPLPGPLAAPAPLGDPRGGSLQSSAGTSGLWGSWGRAGPGLGGCPRSGGGCLGAQGRGEEAGRPCCPVHRRRGAAASRNPLPTGVSPLPPALPHPAGERQQAAAGRGRGGRGGFAAPHQPPPAPSLRRRGGRQPCAPQQWGNHPGEGSQKREADGSLPPPPLP